MSLNERRAFSRSSATIVLSMASITGCHGDRTQQNSIERPLQQADHCTVLTIQEATRESTHAADVMPIYGIDHLELFVGNAAQAACYYARAFAFTETAFKGLETGARDRVSHVLEQGR